MASWVLRSQPAGPACHARGCTFKLGAFTRDTHPGMRTAQCGSSQDQCTASRPLCACGLTAAAAAQMAGQADELLRASPCMSWRAVESQPSPCCDSAAPLHGTRSLLLDMAEPTLSVPVHAKQLSPPAPLQQVKKERRPTCLGVPSSQQGCAAGSASQGAGLPGCCFKPQTLNMAGPPSSAAPSPVTGRPHPACPTQHGGKHGMRLQDQVKEQTPSSGGLGSFFGILIAGSIGIIAVTPRGQPVKKSGGGSPAPSGGNGVSAPTSGTGEKYPTAAAAKDSKPDQGGKCPAQQLICP